MAAPKIVLMTGSTSGIGLATAERLAKDPDKRFLVIATVISFAEQDDLVAAVGDALDKTVFIKELDVTKDEQINSVVGDVIKEHGRIDILLSIAGVCISGLIETMSRDQIDLMFNINTLGVIRLTQAVLPHMKQRKEGKIIAVTSGAGRFGVAFVEVYSSSKFAVEGFLESIAPVCRQFNIRVSIVEPALVNTRLLTNDIFGGVGAVAANQSLDDLDRRFAREWMGAMKNRPVLEPAVVTETIQEIIDVEKPVLRYPIPSDRFALMTEAFGDCTGEKLVQMQCAKIGVKESECLNLPIHI